MLSSVKNKTWLLLVSFILLLVLSACNTETSNEEADQAKEDGQKTIQIGYQKFGTLNFLKAQETLEKELEPKGFTVTWTEFPGGPQLLEALNVGSLDFGHTGEAPPIFAQAADAPLIYFANEPKNPKGEAIIVPKDSPIQSVADLKGKKIALNKGSNVHYLLVKALEANGLKYEDVETSFLPPSDARAAFEKGVVDAWVIWDPFLAEAERKTGARILVDGTNLVNNREFFLASKEFAEENPEVLDIIYNEIDKAETWVSENKNEAAEFLAPQIGMDKETLDIVLERRTYGIEKITDEVINDQQAIADQFYKLQLIPKEIKTSDATLETN
ncbi:sulfonate ABC transporter substrate-binding protein [Domibacillus aminovorans]|nr:sulfonate ABC transporter substrate-binding protein [Domibacillus aminovorans]